MTCMHFDHLHNSVSDTIINFFFFCLTRPSFFNTDWSQPTMGLHYTVYSPVNQHCHDDGCHRFRRGVIHWAWVLLTIPEWVDISVTSPKVYHLPALVIDTECWPTLLVTLQQLPAQPIWHAGRTDRKKKGDIKQRKRTKQVLTRGEEDRSRSLIYISDVLKARGNRASHVNPPLSWGPPAHDEPWC